MNRAKRLKKARHHLARAHRHLRKVKRTDELDHARDLIDMADACMAEARKD